MKSSTQPQPGDRIGGRYEVYQALRGGMGEVYLCLDLEQMLPYALKTLRAEYAGHPGVRKRFEREAAVWVNLEKHPHIVRCFHMEIIHNRPFLALEWVTGESGKGTDLRSWMSGSPLTPRLALQFAVDIARGLQHAQARQPGMVHRDLKPENVLVGQDRRAKITDWGLAKLVDEVKAPEGERSSASGVSGGDKRLTQAGSVVGTPLYMAPEQWENSELDQRTDIYAVGCILFEMLSGQPLIALQEASRFASLGRKLRGAFGLPARDNSDCRLPRNATLPDAARERIDSLIARCVARKPAERYESSETLVRRLEETYRFVIGEDAQDTAVAGIFTANDYNSRGVTFNNLKQYERALSDFDKAIQLTPNYAPAYSNRGMAYGAMNQFQSAIEDFNQALRLDPNLSQAYANRGLAYSISQDYERALADFDMAIRLDANNALVYTNRGNLYSNRKEYKRALLDHSNAIRVDANYAGAYYNRGNTYLELHQNDSAIQDFSEAIRLDPNLISAYSNRGVAYTARQEYNRAMADYNEALQRDPQAASAYYNRGNLYTQQQKHEYAIVEFGEAIRCNPNYSLAYSARGNAHLSLNAPESAILDYDQAILLDQNNAVAFCGRGAAYSALNRKDPAIQDFNMAIQLNPGDAVAYYNRGLTYANHLDYVRAIADYNQAIRLVPGSASFYYSRGAAYVNSGSLAEGLPDLERARQLGHPTAEQTIALVRQHLSKPQ